MELGARVGRLRPPTVSLLAVPGRLFCFGSLVILDVAPCYYGLVVCEYKGGYKWLLNFGLAGGSRCERLLFAWLSLVVSMMVSFCAVLFPTRCLG